jgi:hypothetical protein
MATVSDWIDRDELLSALGRQPTDRQLEWFGISRAQFRAWSKKAGVRVSVALGRLIRYRQQFHLAELLGPDWEGFAVHGKALEFPGLNRALPVGELRSLWFHIQQVGFWKHQAERTARELAQREADIEALQARVDFYRQQVRLEAGMGLMLARMAA